MGVDMKDHELRELINDVTAVAKIYAHTQQLREQISHLIIPVFAKAEAKIKAVEDRQLQCASAMRREILMHEKQVMRQQEEMIACLKDKENLNRQLDFEVKQRTKLRKELAAKLPPTPTPSSGNNP